MTRRNVVIILALVVFCAAGIAVWSMVLRRPTPPHLKGGAERTVEDYQKLTRSNWDRWASMPKLEIEALSDADVAGIFEIALADSGEASLSGEHVATLAKRLAHEVRVRSGSDAKAYIAWAESRRGERWITPDDRHAWSRESTVMRELFDEELTMVGLKDAIRRFLDEARIKNDRAVFQAIADPSVCVSGCFRTRAFRVRSAEQFLLQSSRSYPTEQEADDWLSSPVASISRFRVAERSLDDVCSRSGSAVVVQVSAVMDLQGDRSGIWETIWYWDPLSAAWQLERMGWRSGHITGLWY